MSQKALELFQARFADSVKTSGSTHGDEWALVDGTKIAEMAMFLKTEPSLEMRLLADITACDYLQYDPEHPLALDDPERFEVVYHFGSVTTHQRLRLRIRCGGAGEITVPSITSVYRTADWWERLVWDFYGVRFAGHPNMRRILTYEEFKGHPLRKDYPIHLRQPLTPERHVHDLVRGPGPGASQKHAPFSQRPGARPNTKSDAYD
jgi:NADH-quinone oxidoreductase subunit C